jgi:hypothetical protein
VNPTRILQLVIVALVALGAAFALGLGVAHTRQRAALAHAARESDSLRFALASRVATVLRDTVRVDSIVTRWRRRVDTLPGRVDTLPGRVDTVPLLTLATETITALDTARRACVSVLRDCTQANAVALQRAERAEARAVQLQASVDRRSRWGMARDVVCATSLFGNVIQWSAR